MHESPRAWFGAAGAAHGAQSIRKPGPRAGGARFPLERVMPSARKPITLGIWINRRTTLHDLSAWPYMCMVQFAWATPTR